MNHVAANRAVAATRTAANRGVAVAVAGARGAALAALLVLFAATAAAPAQTVRRAGADTVSAPIRDVHYDVTFLRRTANMRAAEVAMTFTVDGGRAPIYLSLPAWTPGSYEIDNFARWVTSFQATSAGHALAWDKADYDTWCVRPWGAGSQRVRVSFTYLADSLDNAMAWAKSDFLLFNGTNFFLYPRGQPFDFPATVTVATESDWRVATSMDRAPERGADSADHETARTTYRASTYHDLVDMPFFVGRFDLDSQRIADRWVRLASYPAGRVAGAARATAWSQLERVIPPEAAVFREVPWPSYTVMEIVDSAYGGYEGLEHQSSHVDVMAPSYVGSADQASLFAHEIFHSWNVKRLRPAAMWPYDYARPQPTPWLWVSEGITDYYADLAAVRGGAVDERGFYAATAAKINEVMDAPPSSLHDESVDTWIRPLDGSAYAYYPQGSLAGLALDIMIRDASDDARSLDDVMRSLYESTYKRGRGFTAADWWGAVVAAAGGGGAAASFARFDAQYVDGREALPWDSLLARAGLRARRAHVPRLGVMTQQDAQGIVVAQVVSGGAAVAAGVRAGDYLLGVGDIPVDDQDFGAKLRAKYASTAEGTPLPIKIRRNGETLVLAGQLRFGLGDVMVDADPHATEKAARIRDGILHGTTTRQGG
jgi:predicted metalloprotease with PDZ domain